MPRSGIFQLTIGTDRSFGSIRFLILPVALAILGFMSSHGNALAVTLTNGSEVTGSITGGQIDQWTFTAADGDSIWVSASRWGRTRRSSPAST